MIAAAKRAHSVNAASRQFSRRGSFFLVPVDNLVEVVAATPRQTRHFSYLPLFAQSLRHPLCPCFSASCCWRNRSLRDVNPKLNAPGPATGVLHTFNSTIARPERGF